MAEKKYKLRFDMSDGSTKEAEFSVPTYAARPQDYGARGDGSTDDTAAFQSALAANRVVHVPGGEYKLSGELVIGNNCCLELSQDTVLNFTQTSGNCISMKMSASIKGNHATINVPYTFSGNAIYVSTTLNDNVLEIPPWAKWTPQWKTGRYITDLNITKANSNGFHYSDDGTCYGTAVYISADNSGTVETRSTFIWGLNFSGLRIAGGFNYGIRAQNFNNAWNHEMRIEAFIDACKIGVSLEHCNNAYISATIQPRKAANEKPYAVHGIKLDSCENTDLTGSRVWDWNAENSLWSYDKSNVNQHIAMYGNCKGTIMNDYLYNYLPTGFNDIRELIYCEAAYKDINFNTLVISQEPITRWFKPEDNEPYFNNGVDGNQRLSLKKEVDAYFDASYVPNFTDVLSQAGDGTGAVYNGIGYKHGYSWAVDGKTLVENNWATCTGYIPCATGDTIYVDGMSINKTQNDDFRVILFDFNYAKLVHVNQSLLVTNASYYNIDSYTETDNGFSFRIVKAGTAFIKMNVDRSSVTTKPAVSRNEPISYTQSGFLADGIKVKAENVIGLPGAGSGGTGGAQPDWNAGPGEPGHILDRTHWSEVAEVELLPETTGVPGQEMGLDGFALVGAMSALAPGTAYKVTYNGVNYTCTAFQLPPEMNNLIAMGNMFAVGGANTGEPFVFAQYPAEYQQATGKCAFIIPMDGATSVTVSISGEGEIVHELAGKYLPEGTPYVESKPYSFPETTGIPIESSVFAIASKIELTEGNIYTVTYNGVEYECKCGYASVDGNRGLYLGNGLLVGDTDNVTDAPFAIFSLFKPVEGMWGMILDLNAPTTAVFSISGTSDTALRLDERLLPEDFGVKMFFATTHKGSHPIDNVDNVTFLFTYEDLKKVYKQGKSAVIRIQHSAEDFSDFHLNGCQNGKFIFSIAHSNAIYTIRFGSSNVELEKKTFSA